MQRYDTPQPNKATLRDVAAKLRDLEQQGGGLAGLAHACAAFLLIAFSLGSLISLSYGALQHFLAQWNAGTFDLISAISVAVSLLLVVSMDIAMLYAASVIRVRASAGARSGEYKGHIAVMATACLLESATYWYMIHEFDNPVSKLLLLIAIGRAVGAPIFATYLSMARPLPVTPRDIAYQASLASGKGVIHDVTVLADDPDAPLARKVAIYRAASAMLPGDRERFDAILHATARSPEEARALMGQSAQPAAQVTPVQARTVAITTPMEVAPVAPKAASLDAQIGVTGDDDAGPSPDDDGPGGGGGLPARGRSATPRPLATVSAINSVASARNSRALAAHEGNRGQEWDWQELRDYAQRTYDVDEMTRAEALALIRQCDTARRDAKRPGRPLVASRKQLEQRVRLALGIRGAGNPNPAHPTLRASA